MPQRLLFWVQTLLGSGHFGRAQNLAAALADAGFEVTLVNGGRPLTWLERASVEVVDLPSVSAADAGFTALVDASGRPVDASFWADRRHRLLELFDRLRPAAVVSEMFPFGRRAFRGELLPLLERARQAGAIRVGSVRDVLVEAPPDKLRWMRDIALEHYDLLLAHTDPKVMPFGLTFPHRGELGDRLIETGFIVPRPAPPSSAIGRGEVIVSAGGGRVGSGLLAAAIEASRLSRQPARWRVIAPDQAAVEALAPNRHDRLIVDRQRSDFRDLLANGLLSVSQAGYNTIWEALAYEKRMVVVPFEHAGETEQRVRAARLASLGLADVLLESELTPAALAKRVDLTLTAPARPSMPIDLDGAERSARLIARRVAQETGG